MNTRFCLLLDSVVVKILMQYEELFRTLVALFMIWRKQVFKMSIFNTLYSYCH